MLKKQLCIFILSILLVIQPLECNSEKAMQEIQTAGFYAVTGFLVFKAIYKTYSYLTEPITPDNNEEKENKEIFPRFLTQISVQSLGNTYIPNYFHQAIFNYGNNIIDSMQTIVASIMDGIKSSSFFSQKTPKTIINATAYCGVGVISSMLLGYANNYRQTTRFNGFWSDQAWNASACFGNSLVFNALTTQLLSEKQQENNKLVNTLHTFGAVGGIGHQLTCAYLVQKNLTKQT